MSKELDLEIYDIVKIEEGNGSIYLESINKIHNDENAKLAFTDNFVIDLKKVEVNCVSDGDPYQLEMVWRLDSNRNYIMIYPIQRLESIDNAKPSEALECLKIIENNIIYTLRDCDINDEVCQNLQYAKTKMLPIEQALLKAQEQEQKLDRVEKLTNLPFKERRKIGQEYIKWCEKNNAVFDDVTNMITWVLCIKLKEVL